MTTQLLFQVHLNWDANEGGTNADQDYSKNYSITTDGIQSIVLGSASSSFKGDPTRHNPETFLLSSVSACHMLWFLYLAKTSGVVVVDYKDQPSCILELQGSSGHIIEMILRPQITITRIEETEHVKQLQEKAHEKCYMANSVKFPVKVDPIVIVAN